MQSQLVLVGCSNRWLFRWKPTDKSREQNGKESPGTAEKTGLKRLVFPGAQGARVCLLASESRDKDNS